MPGSWWFILAALLALRLASLRRFWLLPVKFGADRFSTVQFTPRAFQEHGRPILRQYRSRLVGLMLLDAAVVAFLAGSGRVRYIFAEQFVSLVLTAIAYNVLLAHFAVRARAAAPASELPPVTAVLVSLENRRLRDFSYVSIEAGIGTAIILALVLWLWRHPFPTRVVLQAAWLLYLLVGLLLVKQAFVRWRLQLPVQRTEDFRRWRTAWLAYHMRIFDALRLCAALGLLQVIALQAFEPAWESPAARWALVIAWSAVIVLLAVYGSRERRRLRRVELEVRPHELVREFPPAPFESGRFLAGGRFYLDADHPSMLARSPRGLALNLAHRGTYLWGAYLIGLALLLARQVAT